MAESIVQVTEGSGKKLHTWNRTIGANSVEDEYVLEGEPALASYTANISGISIATASSHLFQIMAGASLKVRIRRIEVYQSTAATTAALMLLQLIRVTTAGTGGGVTYMASHDPSDGASGAVGMTLPTAKGTEVATVWRHGVVYLMQTIAASAQLAQPSLVWDFDTPRSKPMIIAAGLTNGFVVKNVGAHAGATVTINVVLDESSF